MQEAMSVNREIIGLVGSLIGWGGFLALVVIFKGAIVQAFSLAAARVILSTEGKEAQKWLIRCLVRRSITLRQLYREMKEDEEAEEEGLKSSRSRRKEEEG